MSATIDPTTAEASEATDAPRPKFSVIIAAYNAERTIGAAISSILMQTLDAPVEVIVVDDGSSDRTRAICESYGDLVTYLLVENGGSASARNHGLRIARGEFIGFCDADDQYLPPFLADSLAAYEHAGAGRRIVANEAQLVTPTGIAHGRLMIRGKIPPPERQRMAMLQKNFVTIFAVFPRQLLEEIGLFDDRLGYREDWEFWLRAVLAGWEVVYQTQPNALYQWTPGAKSTKAEGYLAEDEIMRRVLDDPANNLSVDERAFVQLRLASKPPRLLDLRGEQAVRRGEHAEARAIFADLARLSSEDRRTRVKAEVLARVPGATHLWKLRQSRMDASLGDRGDEQQA